MRKLQLRKTKDIKPGSSNSEPVFLIFTVSYTNYKHDCFREKAKVIIAIIEIKNTYSIDPSNHTKLLIYKHCDPQKWQINLVQPM